MVVGYLNNKKMESDGKEIFFKEGMINFPLLPSLHITVNQNKKEDKGEKEPDYYISLVKPRGYAGPKSRIGALWTKKIEKQDSPKYGQSYLSGNIETPIVQGGALYISIFAVDKPKEGETPKAWAYEILWSPLKPREDNNYAQNETYIPTNYEIEDCEEIPF